MLSLREEGMKELRALRGTGHWSLMDPAAPMAGSAQLVEGSVEGWRGAAPLLRTGAGVSARGHEGASAQPALSLHQPSAQSWA